MKGSPKPPPPPSARRAEPGKPTSVRQLTADAQATPPAAAVEPEVVAFEVAGGASWTARAMGASIGPRGTAAAPLLLLRFTRDKEEGVESTKSEGSGDKQAWVPGRTLSDLSVEQLVDAFRTARPWSESAGTRPFFDGIGGQRRR